MVIIVEVDSVLECGGITLTDCPNCVTLSTVMHGRVFYEFCQLLVYK